MCNTTDGLISPVRSNTTASETVKACLQKQSRIQNSSLSSPASSVTRGRGGAREIKAEEESEDEKEMGRRNIKIEGLG